MVKLLVLMMQDNVAQWSLGTQSMALMQLLYERSFISKNMVEDSICACVHNP
jgi:hypothetical protein